MPPPSLGAAALDAATSSNGRSSGWLREDTFPVLALSLNAPLLPEFSEKNMPPSPPAVRPSPTTGSPALLSTPLLLRPKLG